MERFIPEIRDSEKTYDRGAGLYQGTGIKIFGRGFGPWLYYDVAVIKNINADAIIAEYPFTPQPAITKAITMAADVPVFCGVGD